MAEIHVQAKKKAPTTWLWILVSLIIIAAIVVYMMMRDNAVNDNTINQPKQTSFIMVKHEAGLI